MNLIQWIIVSSPPDATLLLTELNDYRGIFEEITPQGTKYTFKSIPSPRLGRKKELPQKKEPTIPVQVNFSIQHRSTNQAEYTEIAESSTSVLQTSITPEPIRTPTNGLKLSKKLKESRRTFKRPQRSAYTIPNEYSPRRNKLMIAY